MTPPPPEPTPAPRSRLLARGALLGGSFFCLLFAHYHVKPTATPVLFAHLGKEYVHYFYAVVSGVVLLGVLGYNRLAGRWSGVRLAVGLFGGSAVAFGLFYVALDRPERTAPVGGAYYVLVGAYSYFLVGLFWSFCHEIHRAGESVWVYPLVTFGGQIGMIAASASVGWVGEAGGPRAGLPLAGVALLVSLGLLLVADRYSAARLGTVRARPVPTSTLTDLRQFVADSYVRRLAAVVVLGACAANLFFYEFYQRVGTQTEGEQAQTLLLARLHFWTGVCAVVLSLVGTPVVLSLVGVARALPFYPLVVLAAAVLLARGAEVRTLGWAAVALWALGYTFYQVIKENLYVPCGREVQYKAKAFCDTAGPHVGDVLSTGLIAVLLVAPFEGPAVAATAVLCAVWFALLVSLGRTYRRVVSSGEQP